MGKSSGKQMKQHKKSTFEVHEAENAQGKETIRSSLCYATVNHSDLPKKPGFSKRQWRNEITTPDTSQPLALNVFSVLYRGRSVQLRSGQTGLSWRLWGSVLATGLQHLSLHFNLKVAA